MNTSGVIPGNYCCCPPLADWSLRLGKCISVLLSRCITSLSATMASLFMSMLGNDRGSCGKKLTDIHGNMSSYPRGCWNLPLPKLSFSKLSHRTQIFTCYFAHWKWSVHILLPVMSLSTILHSFFSQNSDQWDIPLARAHKLIYNCTASHFFFWIKRTIMRTSWCPVPGRISLHHCASEMSQRWVVIYFWVVCARGAEPSINQPHIFSSVNCCRELPIME